jgi:acyl carrier protein
MEEFKQALRRALIGRFGVKKEVLNEETKLFSDGLLDSLTVMELVSFVEGEIGCFIPPTEITLENFDTIDRIVRFISALKAAEGAP